jgi:hypothetical protein
MQKNMQKYAQEHAEYVLKFAEYETRYVEYTQKSKICHLEYAESDVPFKICIICSN